MNQKDNSNRPYYMEISLQAKQKYHRSPRKKIKKIRLNIHKSKINDDQQRASARIIYTPMGGQNKR